MPTTRKTTAPTSWVRFHDLSDVSVQGVRIPKSQLLRTRRRATPITHSRTDKVTTETELTLTSTPTVESTAATWIAAMSSRVAIPTVMYARRRSELDREWLLSPSHCSAPNQLVVGLAPGDMLLPRIREALVSTAGTLDPAAPHR